jgi:hypothetical protein
VLAAIAALMLGPASEDLSQRTETVTTSFDDVRHGSPPLHCALGFELVHLSREVTPDEPHIVRGTIGLTFPSEDANPVFALELSIQPAHADKGVAPAAALFILDGKLNSDDLIAADVSSDKTKGRFDFAPGERTQQAILDSIVETRAISFIYSLKDPDLIEEVTIDMDDKSEHDDRIPGHADGSIHDQFVQCIARAPQQFRLPQK